MATPTVTAAVMNIPGTQLTYTLSEACTRGVGFSEFATILQSLTRSYDLEYNTGDGTDTWVFDVINGTVGAAATEGACIVWWDGPTNGIEADSDAADLAAFTAQAVTNNSTQTPRCTVTVGTIAGTKKVGHTIQCNCAYSVFGAGRADEHWAVWDITVAPSGNTYAGLRLRSGTTQGYVIDYAGGAWQGMTYTLQLKIAGTYTIRCTLYANDGTGYADTADQVAAAASTTTIYVDGTASGDDDGSTPANAFETPDAAMAAAQAAGGDRIISFAGSQTYSPAARTDLTVSGLHLKWDESGTMPKIDMSTAEMFRLNGNLDDFTLEGFDLQQTDSGGTRTLVTIQNGLLIRDLALIGCRCTSGKAHSLIEVTTAVGCRLNMIDCDLSEAGEFEDYSGFFGKWEAACCECVFAGSSAERTIRGSNRSMITLVNCRTMEGTASKPLRIQSGRLHTFHDCQCDDGILMGQNAGSPDNVRISGAFADTDLHETFFTITTSPDNNNATWRCKATIAYSVWERDGAASEAGRMITVQNGGDNDFTMIGCTGESPDPGNNASFGRVDTFVDSTLTMRGNLFIYTGTAVDGNTRFMQIDPVTATLDITENVWPTDTALVTGDPYKANGNKTLAEWNALTGIGTDTAADRVLDGDFLPDAQDAVAAMPDGAGFDFYSNVITLGGSGFAGAVQSVPAPEFSTDDTLRDRGRGRDRVAV